MMHYHSIVSLVDERISKGRNFPADDKKTHDAFISVHKAAIAMGKKFFPILK